MFRSKYRKVSLCSQKFNAENEISGVSTLYVAIYSTTTSSDVEKSDLKNASEIGLLQELVGFSDFDERLLSNAMEPTIMDTMVGHPYP